MNNFKPSNNILEKICSDITTLENYYYGINRIDYFIDDRESSNELREMILKKYNIKKLKDREKGKHLLYSHHEAAKNCLAHGTNNANNIIISHHIGDLGICCGFYDGGDYFKNEHIKNQYENKIPVTEFNKNPNIKCNKRGTDRIFRFTDFIEVDSKKGILYLGFYKNTFM